MTLLYSIDPDKKIAYVTPPEKSTLADDLEIVRRLAADERLGEGFGILVDIRASSFLPSAGEARRMALELSGKGVFTHHPIAVVVSQRVQYGIANMTSIIAEMYGVTIQVFYDIEAAETWLQTIHLRE